MILAIDFDGVLHNQKDRDEGRKMGKPVEGAYAAMVQLKTEGHYLIIHSVWAAPAMYDWLRFYQIPYDEITNIKPKADFYIDDKAIKFTNWADCLRCLTN